MQYTFKILFSFGFDSGRTSVNASLLVCSNIPLSYENYLDASLFLVRKIGNDLYRIHLHHLLLMHDMTD
jgi:hypothetical protein